MPRDILNHSMYAKNREHHPHLQPIPMEREIIHPQPIKAVDLEKLKRLKLIQYLISQ